MEWLEGAVSVLHMGEGMERTMKRLILAAAALACAASLASASGTEEDSTVDLSGIEVIVVRSGSLDVRVSGSDGAEVSLV